MKNWKRQQGANQAPAPAAHAAAVAHEHHHPTPQPAGQPKAAFVARPVGALVPPGTVVQPARNWPALPAIGVPIFVYGLDHLGFGYLAFVTAVNPLDGTLNVGGFRRNGQVFGETHVPWYAVADKPDTGVYAIAGLNDPKDPPPVLVPVQPAPMVVEPLATLGPLPQGQVSSTGEPLPTPPVPTAASVAAMQAANQAAAQPPMAWPRRRRWQPPAASSGAATPASVAAQAGGSNSQPGEGAGVP